MKAVESDCGTSSVKRQSAATEWMVYGVKIDPLLYLYLTDKDTIKTPMFFPESFIVIVT